MEIYIEAMVVINSILVWTIILGPDHAPHSLVTFTGNLEISFCADGLGMLFAGLVSALWPLAVLYSFPYMEHEKNSLSHENIFYWFYTTTYGVTLGIAMAEDFITLYCFYEMLTLVTVPLVIQQYIENYCLRNGIRREERIFPLTERAIQKQLKIVCDYLGYEGISTHSFRKWYATEIYKANGFDIALVQRLLQHASASTTQRYIGIEPQQTFDLGIEIAQIFLFGGKLPAFSQRAAIVIFRAHMLPG